jgi:hypothetical protein
MELAVDAKLSTEVEVRAYEAKLENARGRLALFDGYLNMFQSAIEAKGVSSELDRRVADWHRASQRI